MQGDRFTLSRMELLFREYNTSRKKQILQGDQDSSNFFLKKRKFCQEGNIVEENQVLGSGKVIWLSVSRRWKAT
jgi:hypothetical protein